MKQNKKQDIKINVVKSNSKVDEIIEDYPQELKVSPRASFEDQLKKHLLKHNIK